MTVRKILTSATSVFLLSATCTDSAAADPQTHITEDTATAASPEIKENSTLPTEDLFQYLSDNGYIPIAVFDRHIKIPLALNIGAEPTFETMILAATEDKDWIILKKLVNPDKSKIDNMGTGLEFFPEHFNPYYMMAKGSGSKQVPSPFIRGVTNNGTQLFGIYFNRNVADNGVIPHFYMQAATGSVTSTNYMDSFDINPEAFSRIFDQWMPTTYDIDSTHPDFKFEENGAIYYQR